MNRKKGPPPDGKGLKRTFPKKGKPGSGGPAAKKKKVEEKPKTSAFLSEIFKKEKWKDTDELKMLIADNCFLLLHCVAIVQKGKLRVKTERKGNLYYSQVNLHQLSVDLKPSHAENENDSKSLSAFSFMKCFLASHSILPDATIFIKLMAQSTDSELVTVASMISELIHSFSLAFGSVIKSGKPNKQDGRKCSTFYSARELIMKRLIDFYATEMTNRKMVLTRRAMSDRLSGVDEEMKKVVIDGKEKAKGTKKVFESSDEEEEGDGGGEEAEDEIEKEEDKGPHSAAFKKDPMVSTALRKGGFNDTIEMRMMLTHNAWLLFHAIAKYMKADVKSRVIQKGDRYFATIIMDKMKFHTTGPSIADNRSDALAMSALTFFKYLIGSGGLFKSRVLLFIVLIKSTDSMLIPLAKSMSRLLDVFRKFTQEAARRRKLSMDRKHPAYKIFPRLQSKTTHFLVEMRKSMEHVIVTNKDAESALRLELLPRLSAILKEIEEDMKQMDDGEEKEEDGNSYNFPQEFGDEGAEETMEGDAEALSQVSTVEAVVNGDEELPEETRRKMVKTEVKEEIDSIVVKEKKKKKVKKPAKVKEEENEDDDSEASTSENSTTNEFRSNLIDLSISEFERKVKEYGIKNPPSKRDRFEMSQKVLNALEAEYGEKLNDTLKYYTFHEFSTDILQKPDEVIGLLLYLDVKEFVGTSFFFLLLATNDMDTTERAIPLITPLCQSQFKFIKIDKSRSLGKNVNEEWNTLQSEIGERRRQLHLCYPLLFSSVLKKRTMALFTQETDVEEAKKKKIKQEPIDFEMNKRIKKEKMDDGMDIDDFCEVIDVPKKRVKVEIISDEEAEGKRKRKKKKSESRDEDDDKVDQSRPDDSTDLLRKVKQERIHEAESTSTSAFHKEVESNGYDDRASSKGDSREDDDSALIVFRARLVELASEYWKNVCGRTKIINFPKTEDKYKIARVIIRFLEEKCGDDFHQMLFTQTTIKFTPSDLQEQEEVIGLVMWLDRLRMPTGTFFVHLIALNRESECERILTEGLAGFNLRLKVFQLSHRYALGESIRSEQMSADQEYEKEAAELFSRFPTLFAEILSKKGSEEDMKNNLYSNGYWLKFSRHFNIHSDWTYFDVAENALVVFGRLYPMFKGFMKIKKGTTDETKITNISSKHALTKILWLSRLFPDGFIFLLLRNRNTKVLDVVCKNLIALVPMYEKFFLGRESSSWTKEEEQTRLDKMKANSVALKCFEKLRNHLKKSAAAECAPSYLPSTKSHDTMLLDVSQWKMDKKWKVTTTWSRSASMEEWEREHAVEMNEFNKRVDRFFFATVIRLEHYTAKLNAFNAIKTFLGSFLARWNASLSIAGSSPTSLSSSKSNLDIAIASKHVDRAALVSIFEGDPGTIVTKDTGIGSFMVLMKNEKTSDTEMVVTIHLHPSTSFMSSVYQMADKQDERVGKMAIVLKAWRICDPSCVSGKLKSYHLMSLLIHYLQCGVSPPILPSLILINPHKLPEKMIPPENTQSVASLLLGFFTYFADFEFENYVISIRTGRLIKRTSLNLSIDLTLFIENPHAPFKDIPIPSDVNSNVMRAACRRAKKMVETEFKIPYIEQI